MRLALEEFAKACADLDVGVSRSRVLGRLGLDEPAWTELEHDAIGSLRRAFEAGDRSVALCFADAYESALQADPTEPLRPPVHASASGRLPAATASAGARPQESANSGTSREELAAGAGNCRLDETAALGVVPVVYTSLPFRPASAATAPLPEDESGGKVPPDSEICAAAGAQHAKPAHPATAEPAPGDGIDETAEVDLAAIMSAPLPFRPPRPAAVPSAEPESTNEATAPSSGPRAAADAQQAKRAHSVGAEPPRGESLDGTAEVDLALIMNAPLPFGEAGGDTADAGPPTVIDETAVLGVPVVVEEPLPFQRADGPSSAPPTALAEPAEHPDAGETQLATRAVVGPATPFDGNQPPERRRSELAAREYVFEAAPLTLRQLAAVHVELQMAPASESGVLRTYGLTADTRRMLDDELRTICRRDPRLAKAWERAWTTYLEWWKRNRPR